MMNSKWKISASYEKNKILLKRLAMYLGYGIGAIILLSMLAFVLFPDFIINYTFKERIIKGFEEANPEYSIQLSRIHFNVWENRLSLDSIQISADDSTFSCRADSLSVTGITWLKIILRRDYSTSLFNKSTLDARKIILNFQKSQYMLGLQKLHISVEDSELTAQLINYSPIINDEQIFRKSKFRQTRFRFDIPSLEIIGLDCLSLLKGELYKAKSIVASDMFTDILVNMDKPYEKGSANPQMPNELFSSLKEEIKIDSVKVTNGRIKYCERFAVGGTPGVISFTNVSASVSGITNSIIKPDTAIIRAEGVFMNSGIMKVQMEIPLTSKVFSFRYSGSLGSMDVTKLNAFVEPAEHQRIKSGHLQSAFFMINVNSGRANGSLKVVYRDLTIALLDKATGSEKGIFNRILSFFGKVFVIRSSNIPDEDGSMKIGEIKYTRNPEDYFLQFAWFALRNGVADVVGFPKTVPLER
ncbi:MAG: hypothetical protein Q8L04_14620 [Ignavibacteria bacterium]|nr:hypothetical protein [Ignavibacteria bacterium]